MASKIGKVLEDNWTEASDVNENLNDAMLEHLGTKLYWHLDDSLVEPLYAVLDMIKDELVIVWL